MQPSLHGPHGNSEWVWRDLPVTCFRHRTTSASFACWMVAMGRYTLAAANSFGMTLASMTVMAASGAKRWGFICPQIPTLTVEMLRGTVGFPCPKLSAPLYRRPRDGWSFVECHKARSLASGVSMTQVDPTCLSMASGAKDCRDRASPCWEVPNPDVVCWALSYAIAITMPAAVVLALVATMAPRIVASGGGGHGTISLALSAAAHTSELPPGPDGDRASHAPRNAPAGESGVPGLAPTAGLRAHVVPCRADPDEGVLGSGH